MKNVTKVKVPVFAWDVDNKCVVTDFKGVSIDDTDKPIVVHAIKSYKLEATDTVEDIIERHNNDHIVVLTNEEKSLMWDESIAIKAFLPNHTSSNPNSNRIVRMCIITDDGKQINPKPRSEDDSET